MLNAYKKEMAEVNRKYFDDLNDLWAKHNQRKYAVLDKESNLINRLFSVMEAQGRPLTAKELHDLMPELSVHEIVGNLQTFVFDPKHSRFRSRVHFPSINYTHPHSEVRKFIMLDSDGSIPENPTIVEKSVSFSAKYEILKD